MIINVYSTVLKALLSDDRGAAMCNLFQYIERYEVSLQYCTVHLFNDNLGYFDENEKNNNESMICRFSSKQRILSLRKHDNSDVST